MAKAFAESKFRGSDYTMVSIVSTKNMLLHLQLEILYTDDVSQNGFLDKINFEITV